MRIDDDRNFMEHALELAARGTGRTRPNPLVGAVLVKDGAIIGEGWHEYFGGPHAEVNAFANCKTDPKGATLYVTLEPCCHYGKTPPCTDLIISKDIDRVVIAMTDPNPLVSGKGIRRLRDAGIFVTTGIMEKEAKKLNEIFMKFITQKKPFVLYKSAMSMDGKTACHTGESQWISSEESRDETHALRGIYASVMVGAGTVKSDNPRLTARMEGMEDPIRIIIDGKLSSPTTAQVFQNPGRVIVLTTSAAEPEKLKELQDLGVEIICADGDTEGMVNLESAMTGLAVNGIDSILLEGGAETAASAFQAGIVDKVRFYMAPLLIGGKNAPGSLGGIGADTLSDAIILENIHTERSGEDLVIEAYVKKKNTSDAAYSGEPSAMKSLPEEKIDEKEAGEEIIPVPVNEEKAGSLPKEKED